MDRRDKYGLGRRQALRLLGAGAFACGFSDRVAAAADSGLPFTGLDHVEFTVSVWEG